MPESMTDQNPNQMPNRPDERLVFIDPAKPEQHFVVSASEIRGYDSPAVEVAANQAIDAAYAEADAEREVSAASTPEAAMNPTEIPTAILQIGTVLEAYRDDAEEFGLAA